MTDKRFLNALAPIALASLPAVTSLLSPSAGWNGASGSGFGGSYPSAPTDPTRTTAKPAARLMTPPGQRFTDELLVLVAAAANNGGTLIGGVEKVRYHFEGGVLDVTEPEVHSFNDSNGNPVSYWGYGATLKKPALIGGTGVLYVEVFPADATMQNRVLGPFYVYPAATLHDAEYTIDTGESVSATNFHTFDAAVAQIKTDDPANPLLTFVTGATNEPMTANAPTWGPSGGYLTVEAQAAVTFGMASLDTSAAVDSTNYLRPRLNGLWLKGENITIDFAYVGELYGEGTLPYVLDGITMTNSRGANALWRGGPYFTGFRVRNLCYFLEVTASNLENVCLAAALVRGGTFTAMSRDIFADALCLVGTRVVSHSDTAFNNDVDACTITYDTGVGAESSATVERTGLVDPNSCAYNFTWGANSASFDTGKTAAIYAGDSGDGYTFADLVDFVNGDGDYAGVGLADSDAGWSAVLHDTDGRRASSGTLAGPPKAQGFAATDCTGAGLLVSSSFDAHGDWYQQRFNFLPENVIAYDNVAADMQTQNIFLSSNIDCRDYIFFNNALGNDPVGSDYFSTSTVFSQLGRSNSATAISHVVIVHNSMPNQAFTLRDDGTASTFDAYSLIAANSLRDLNDSAANLIDAEIVANHIHGGETPLNEAVDTTSGGDATTLYADYELPDYTPAGDLLTNLTAPLVARDAAGNLRAASDAKGAFRVSA